MLTEPKPSLTNTLSLNRVQTQIKYNILGLKHIYDAKPKHITKPSNDNASVTLTKGNLNKEGIVQMTTFNCTLTP